jgi:hypothetical protein
MAHQGLENSEVLNVRWATVDPNPAAQKREARQIEEQAAEAIRKALPPEFVAELEGRDPEAKKRRKLEGNFGLEGYDAPDEVWYEKEKAEWTAQTRGLPATSEEAAVDGADEPLKLDAAPESYETGAGGIFSGSTLAALKSRKATAAVVAKKPAAASGPLVAYGSDDDSD